MKSDIFAEYKIIVGSGGAIIQLLAWSWELNGGSHGGYE
jgi:hypothetical protein